MATLALVGEAGAATFTPVADTFVTSATPRDNFGDSTQLRAAGSPDVRSYLRFEVQGVTGTISRATLRLYANSSSSIGYDARGASKTNWNERTVTYRNAPAVSSTISGSSGSFLAGWTTVDVTPLVASNGTVSIALTSSTTTAISLASRETGVTAPQLIVDTADLTPPAVTLTTPANGSSTNNATPTLSGAAGTAAGDSATVTAKIYSGTSVSGTPVRTLSATRSGGSWSVTPLALAQGTYTARAEQADSAGNVGFSNTNTFTIDTSGPLVTLDAPADGSSTTDATPTLSGAAGTAAGDSATVTARIYSGTSVSGTPVQTLTATRSSGSWTVDAAPLADGTYTARAQQADGAGNVGFSSANTFTVDTGAPVVTLVEPADGSATNDTTPSLSGAAGTAAGDSATVTARIYSGTSVSGTLVQTLTATRSSGSWTVDAAPLAEGTYTARAQQADSDANVGFSSANTFKIDTSSPLVTLDTPADGSSTTDATPTLSGAAGTAAGDSATVTARIYSGTSISGTPVQTLTATRSSGSWTVDAAPLANGTYTARAQQGDSAGNVGLSAANTFSVAAPASSTYRDEVMADGPQAYWRLGETSGTTAGDQTANGNSGTYLNGVSLGQAGALSGVANTAAGFDGVNDTVRVLNSSSLNLPTGITVEAWINATSSVQSTIVRKDFAYLLRRNGDGGATCRLWKGGLDRELGTAAGILTAGEWHHLVCTWDGATMRIYVDGTARSTLSVASPVDVTSNDLYIGSSYNSYNWFAGRIDEVAVYDHALTATRVQVHYTKANVQDTTGPSVVLKAPANGSAMDATPNFGGSAGRAAGDSDTVTIKVYSGTSATGTPVRTPIAAVQPAGTFSVKLGSALPSGTYTAQAEQADGAGNIGQSAPKTFTVDASADPVVLSAGDIAACDTFGDEATAALLDRLPGTVATLGDHVYEYATSFDFTNCYDPTWGRHKARTKPTVGDHEYLSTSATPYFNYFGAAAADPTKGYYSYDLGSWHIVSMNTNCGEVPGGCFTGSPEEQWLRADLAAHPASCTLAILHNPRFSSGSIHGSQSDYEDFWQALYEAGAELALSGDDHLYERFAPQTPTGAWDPVGGIRQFVVGTGGRSHYTFGPIEPNSQVRNNDTFGVLELTLHPTSYDWEFVPEAGKTFSDSGSTSCH